MSQKKILFIDRDGTLLEEPSDFQVDRIDKLNFIPGVVSSLIQLKNAGFSLVMVSNQDGLGSSDFPLQDFKIVHELMLRILSSQGITFDDIRICPHRPSDQCSCRKPEIGLVLDYLVEQTIDRDLSYVIGDRETDMQFAKKLGIMGIRIQNDSPRAWSDIVKQILSKSRTSMVTRTTTETAIHAVINLDGQDESRIDTGIGFFDHMLEQLAKHAGFNLSLTVKGDVHVDDHHTVEDAAIVLGEAVRKALADKLGIARYGFVLPMDEALTQVAIDLSGRCYCQFTGKFPRERVGDLSTELIPHFFRSFSESLKAAVHIEVKGENTHHMVESIFKCVGRALRQAITKNDNQLPSTKGVL